MKRILATAVALTLIAALAVPSVAAAGSDDRALAQESYYSSYGEPAALTARCPRRRPPSLATPEHGRWSRSAPARSCSSSARPSWSR